MVEGSYQLGIHRWSWAPTHPHHAQIAQAISLLLTSKRLRSTHAKVRTINVREVIVNWALVAGGISGHRYFNCKQSFGYHHPLKRFTAITIGQTSIDRADTNHSYTLIILRWYCSSNSLREPLLERRASTTWSDSPAARN